MPLIAPFRGLRYHSRLGHSIGDLIAPPYDVVCREERSSLHDRHRYNFVRLEAGIDTPSEDRYQHAARLLDEWLADDVLIEDERPAYYIYEQSFEVPVDSPEDGSRSECRRRALFASVRVGPWGDGVYRHELTLSEPKADRMRLLTACRTNLSPIFGIVRDPRGLLDAVLSDPPSGTDLVVDAKDGSGQRHSVWRLFDPDGLRAIERCVADTAITIADGHHRYETAVAYRDRLRSDSSQWPVAHSADRVLMALVSDASDSLIVRPVHRLVSGLDSQTIASLPSSLERLFHVDRRPFSPQTDALVRRRLLAEIQAATTPTFGLYSGGDDYLMLSSRAAPSNTDEIGVVALQRSLLGPVLAVQADANSGPDLTYAARDEEAVHRVRNGTAQLALFVASLRVSDVERVATSGDTLPQKSTYFYPKFPSGLISRRLI